MVIRVGNAWTGPNDASFGIGFARDDQLLFIGAEVHDDVIVRSHGHAANDDALLVAFGAPAGVNRTVGYDIAIYPGDPGNYRGAVRFHGSRSGRRAGGRVVVEAPLHDGSGLFHRSQLIPWRAIPEVLSGIASLRARAAYQDNDSAARGTVDSVIASGPGDGQHLTDLPPIVGSNANGTADLMEQFRQSHPRGGGDPFLDRSANVAGVAALEHIVVFPRYASGRWAGHRGRVALRFPRISVHPTR